MRSICTSCITLAVLFLGLVAGCSRSGNPITPGELSRGAEWFSESEEVFDGAEHPYRDLDIATLIKKGEDIYDTLPAEIWHDGAEHRFSIMVSIQDLGPPDHKVPMYRWLKDDGTAACDETAFGVSSGPYVDYKFPKVDAIWVPEEGSIRVAVSFMWRFLQPPPLYDDSWNVGVIFLHWWENQFADAPIPPPNLEDLSHVMELYADGTQWGHDIAFDAYQGDGYLVYTTDTGAMQCPYRLWYYHFTEDPEEGDPEWRFLGPWWAVDDDFVGNMWLPSLDVGLCVMPTYQGQARDSIGVAFTYKEPDPEPYKVAYNYWTWDQTGDQTANTGILENPYVDPDLNYGLPCLDIAPSSCDPPYFAVTWVHENYEDWMYDVWVYDSFNEVMMRLHHPKPLDPDTQQKTLPSIACHYSGLLQPAEASVSMYENEAEQEPTDDYQPVAVRVRFNPHNSQILSWETVDSGFNGVFGPWGPFNVAFMDSGVATDIVLDQDNDYYIGFADSIGTVTDPTTVYAAWGNTTQ